MEQNEQASGTGEYVDTVHNKIEDTIFDRLGTLPEQDARKVAKVVAAIGEAIHDLGQVPSGHLYASIMSTQMTISVYSMCITLLRRASLVSEKGHELKWIGGF